MRTHSQTQTYTQANTVMVVNMPAFPAIEGDGRGGVKGKGLILNNPIVVLILCNKFNSLSDHKRSEDKENCKDTPISLLQNIIE